MRSAGFIRSTSRALDLFFHHSDLHPDLAPEQLSVGLEVQFTPCRDPDSNRLVAKAVQRAASGAVVFHVVSERQYLGQVLELPAQLGAAAATSPAGPGPGTATTVAAAPSALSSSACPTAESPGIIRYLPQAGRVQHIMFRSCDVAAVGCRGAGALQPEALVLFNICTDTRAASNAVRAGGKSVGNATLGASWAAVVADADLAGGSAQHQGEARHGAESGSAAATSGSAGGVSGVVGSRASYHAANKAVKVGSRAKAWQECLKTGGSRSSGIGSGAAAVLVLL